MANIQSHGIIPRNVRHNKNLTPIQKLVYAELSALCGNGDYTSATNKDLSNILSIDPLTVSRSISALKDEGHIEVEINKEQGNSRRIYPLYPI